MEAKLSRFFKAQEDDNEKPNKHDEAKTPPSGSNKSL